MNLIRIAALGSVFLTGCATVVVDGHTISEPVWEDSQRDVRSQASFTLHCAPEKLDLHVLEVDTNNYPNFPATVGVTGCGKDAVYKRTASGWSANVISNNG